MRHKKPVPQPTSAFDLGRKEGTKVDSLNQEAKSYIDPNSIHTRNQEFQALKQLKCQ